MVGYQKRGADFGGTTTIETLGDRFHGALVLVGPDDPRSFYVNKTAEEILDRLDIPKDGYQPIHSL